MSWLRGGWGLGGRRLRNFWGGALSAELAAGWPGSETPRPELKADNLLSARLAVCLQWTSTKRMIFYGGIIFAPIGNRWHWTISKIHVGGKWTSEPTLNRRTANRRAGDEGTVARAGQAMARRRGGWDSRRTEFTSAQAGSSSGNWWKGGGRVGRLCGGLHPGLAVASGRWRSAVGYLIPIRDHRATVSATTRHYTITGTGTSLLTHFVRTLQPSLPEP